MGKKSLFLPYLYCLPIPVLLVLLSRILHWDTQNTVWGMVCYLLVCLPLMVISIINAIRCKGSGLRHLFRIIAVFGGVNAIIALIVTAVIPMPLLTAHAAPDLDLPSVTIEEEFRNTQNWVTFGDREYSGMNIASFDISEEGKILVFLDTESFPSLDTHKYANIYNTDGTFLYGITWESSGITYIWWDGEDPVIYDLRKDLICNTGYDSHEPHSYILHDAYDLRAYDALETYAGQSVRTFGDTVYRVYPKSPTCLYRIAPDGTQTEIYRNEEAVGDAVFMLVFMIVVAVLFFWSAIGIRVVGIRNGEASGFRLNDSMRDK